MKIVDRKTFLSLPPETVFSRYEPCIFRELSIKGENCGSNDFFEVNDLATCVRFHGAGDLMFILEQAERVGTSMMMDFETQGRDGAYEDEQLFAVWEPQDVQALIERLQRCLPKEDVK